MPKLIEDALASVAERLERGGKNGLGALNRKRDYTMKRSI